MNPQNEGPGQKKELLLSMRECVVGALTELPCVPQPEVLLSRPRAQAFVSRARRVPRSVDRYQIAVNYDIEYYQTWPRRNVPALLLPRNAEIVGCLLQLPLEGLGRQCGPIGRS